MAIDVDELAQEIRRVDGKHDLGAGALAEALLPFIASSRPPISGGVEAEAVAWAVRCFSGEVVRVASTPEQAEAEAARDHERTVEPLYSASTVSALSAELAGVRKARDEARRKLFPYADATEISGMSWNGFYLIGDKKSISELRRIENTAAQVEVYRAAFDERMKASEARATTAEAENAMLKAELAAREWQSMDTAPLNGKHCILAVKSGAFVYSVQGSYQNGQWNCAMEDDVQPLAWMPNVLLPDHLCPWRAVEGAALPMLPCEGVVEDNLDARMAAAGMIPLSDLLAGNTPVERWTANAGVKDIDSFAEWVGRKNEEYMRMRLRYDLGEEAKDELYEWVFAHSAVFQEVAANLRSALRTGGNGNG